MPLTPSETRPSERQPETIPRETVEAIVDAALDEVHDVLGAVVTGLSPRGAWPAAGSFPADAARGDFWIVSTAGALDGQSFAVGDWLLALVEGASPHRFEGQWARAAYSQVVRPVYADARALIASREPPRGAGALWRTSDGHGYVETAPDAPFRHLTTRGGAGLRVLANADGGQDLGAWGADLTGGAASHAQLQAALDTGAAVVRIPPGATVRLEEDVRLGSNQRLEAPGATLMAVSRTVGLRVEGMAGESSDLFDDAERDRVTCRAVIKDLFHPRDWVVLVNSPDADNDGGPKGRAQQMARVVAVDGSAAAFDQLTLDRALGYHFSVSDTTVPSSIHRVTPLEDAGIEVGTLLGVTVINRLTRGLRLSVDRGGAAGAIQTDPVVPYASERGTVRAFASAPVDASAGPNALVDLRGWDGLQLDVTTEGGREDGVRLFSCLHVRGRACARAYAGRGVNMYKCSGSDLVARAESGTAAGLNVEHVLIDYCSDLDLTPEALGFATGDGIEIRGRASGITLRSPRSVARAGSSTSTCINIHPASPGQVCRNIRVLGGYLAAHAGYGLLGQDGCDGVVIEGLVVEALPGSDGIAPLSLNADAGFAAPRDVTIRDCRTEGGIAVGGSDALRAQDIRLEGNRVAITSGQSYQVATHADGLTIQGLRFDAAPAGLELRVLDSTQVRMRGNHRPDSRFRYNFAGSDLLEHDDLRSEDVPAAQLALTARPVILDKFDGDDGTPIPRHLPEVGDLWAETAVGGAFLLGGGLRVLTDGNLVHRDLPADRFVASLGFRWPEDGAAVSYSLVFDRAGAADHTEVRFDTAAREISIHERIGGDDVVRATFAAWAAPAGSVETIRAEVNGRFVSVRLGDVEVLRARLARARGATTGGWRRNRADTDAAVLASLMVRAP